MNIIETVYATQSSVGTTPISPLGDLSLNQMVTVVTNAIMVVGVAVFLVMLGLGFVKYVTSQGDKAAVESAQKTLTYAVIGGVGLILVFVFRSILFSLIGVNTSQLQMNN
jgi:hypothetical protein